MLLKCKKFDTKLRTLYASNIYLRVYLPTEDVKFKFLRTFIHGITVYLNKMVICIYVDNVQRTLTTQGNIEE